jgi:hypothetical protein
MPFTFDEKQLEYYSSLKVDLMWNELTEQNFQGEKKFANIGKLAKIVLSLPPSNAESERIFSVVNDVKTAKRNKIGDNTLNAMCVIRSLFRSNSINCATFHPNDEHFKLFNSSIYAKKE